MDELVIKKVGRPKVEKIEDGTWFRYIRGFDERGNNFHHQIEVVTTKDGSVVDVTRSENRGFINLEPILVKVIKNSYLKGKLLDSRFRSVKGDK